MTNVPNSSDRIALYNVAPPSAAQAASVYHLVGDETLRRLVDAFYDRIAVDPLLRPMFPADLTEARENQYLFLVEYFGGPKRYQAKRGHPRMRARHLPFAIGPREAQAWLANMFAAIDEVGIAEPARGWMRGYFTYAAEFFRNREA